MRTISVYISDYFLNWYPEINFLWERIESLFKTLIYIIGFLLRKIIQIKFSLAIFDCFHYSTASLILNNMLILVRPCILICILENTASYLLCFVQSRCSIEIYWQNDNRELVMVFVKIRMDFTTDTTFSMHPGVPKGNQKYLSQIERWKLPLNISVW